MTKQAEGEAAVLEACPGAVILRPCVVFGPEDKFFNLFAGLARFTWFLPVLGGPAMPALKFFEDGALVQIDFYGAGGSRFQPVYVGDVAAAITAIVFSSNSTGTTYELGGPEILTFRQLLERVMQETGRIRQLVPVPFAIMEWKGAVLSLAPRPLLTRDQVRMLRTDNTAEQGLSGLADLDITPTAVAAMNRSVENHVTTTTHALQTPAM